MSRTEMVTRLRAVEDLLQKHRVKYATMVTSVREDVESQNTQNMASARERVRSLFGGMGTLTDVVITERNGHVVQDEAAANDELERLVHELWLTTETMSK